MKKIILPAAVFAACIAFAGCGDDRTSQESFDKAFQTATENVEDAARDAAETLDDASEDFGEFVQDKVDDAQRAIEGRKEGSSNEAR